MVVVGVLPFYISAVDVFYNPSQLGNGLNELGSKSIKTAAIFKREINIEWNVNSFPFSLLDIKHT